MARFQRGTELRDVVLEADEEDARRDYCDAQRELLADGWQRVRDPAREFDESDEPRDEALERALHEHPDDDQIWLVYADHFIQHGHPRGPLIALDSAPVRNLVERAEREAESRRLRHAASDTLLGALAGRTGSSLRWRRGFIDKARVHGGFLRGAAEDLLFDLLRHPSARFLRELVISCWHHDAQDHRLLVALLLQARPAPPLRVLAIEYDNEQWQGLEPLGDLGALGTIYPQLEDVRIEGDNTCSLHGLALPRAKRFAFTTAAMQPHMLRALAAASWPALEELELSLRDSPCTSDDLRFVLALPKLCRLRIHGASFANELVEMLGSSPVAAQIELLDLRHSAFGDPGVHALMRWRSSFPARMRCYLDRTDVTDAGRELLEDHDIVIDSWW